MKISFLRICAIWRRFRRGALRHHIHHERYLPQIEGLMRRADPRASWHARANWMIDLADWMRREPKVSLLDAAEWRRVKQHRVRYMLDWLDANRDVRQAVQMTLQKTLREATGHELFSATGMPRESAFFSELSDRIAKLILPRPIGDCDLSMLFTAMFPEQSDAEWLLGLDQKTLTRLWKLCGDDGIAHGYRQQIDEAMLYLVTMVISVGISPAFRQRLEPRMPLLATPFMALRRELEAFLMQRLPDESALRSVRMLVAVCQAQTDRIYAHLDKYGVSVGLVYHVERLRAQLLRISRLLDLRTAPRSDQGALQVQAVLVDLIVAHHRRASVRDLVSRSFALLARKMVERNADRGEAYIAHDRSTYRTILKAALLGGVIAALPAGAKIGLAHLGPAHFFEGLFLSLIFAISFLLISAAGGVLAARQPAVTAPALAMEMSELDTPGGMRDLLARAAALLRAQWAAVFGNLLAVTPTVLLMALAVWFIGGRPIMHQYRADATLHSLSLLGATPLFAAFTGVLLWLAGLIAGFADNWFALRRLRESIAHHRRVVHALGPNRAERWAAWLERNVASIAGNVALAVLLGMTPSVAQFFGVPLDVRHVTLSAAALTSAAFSLGWHVLATPQFWLAVAGVVAIGLLNVGVAFSCALGLALRARDVSRRTRRMAFRAIWRRWLLRPAEFLWPVATPRAVAEVQDAELDEVEFEGEESEKAPEQQAVAQEEQR
jgi:site-specific recombinase